MLVCFLGIESLGFSEFQHGTKKPYQLVCGRFFGKIFLHLKIGEMGQKEAKKRVFLFWDIGWNAFSCSGCEILNQTFLQSKSMKQPHFFVCWYKFTKIKIWLKSFWWGMVKKSVANLVSGRTDGTDWFFACCYSFTQIKRWLKIFWFGMVKNGCGQSQE